MDENLVAQDVAQDAEKMLPQSQVNKLIGEAKQLAAEKERARLEQQYQMQINQQGQAPMQTHVPQGQMGMGGMAYDETKLADTVFNKVLEKAQEHQARQAQAQQEAEAKRIAEEYDSKMAQGREKYPDFDQVMSDFDPAEFLDVVLMANSMDGTADMLYELAKNPMKLSNVAMMTQKSPKVAKKLLAELGESIKVNDAALQNKASSNTREPLPRLKPSTASADNSGPQSIADFKNASWLQV